MTCPEGKNCKLKCGDQIKFYSGDQRSITCDHFKLTKLIKQGRNRYKLDQEKWMRSNNHVAMGTSEVGKKAPRSEECGLSVTMSSNGYYIIFKRKVLL